MGFKITADGDCSNKIKRRLLLGRKAMSDLDSELKSRELDYKESWALKNWCFQAVMQEKTLESPLDSKEIQPVNPKGNQLWNTIGRADAEAETLIIWPLDVKNWLIGKNPDGEKIESVKSWAVTLLYGPTLISIHDHHCFDYMERCQ